MPALLKILTVFIGMLVVSRLRVPLGAALCVGGVFLLFWAGLPATEVAQAFVAGLRQSEFWLMLAVVALIIELGRYMTQSEHARELVAAAQAWGGRHGRSISLMTVPALIGLVPMPAGALFSAPLVADAVGEADLPAESKTAINYWFRHVWEYWWPLFPGVIVAMSVFGMPTWRFVLLQFPFSILAFAVGYAVLIRPNLARLHLKPDPEHRASVRAFVLMGPLLLVVLTALLLPPVLVRLMPDAKLTTHKLLAMLLGLSGALALTGIHGSGGLRSIARTLTQPHARNVLITLAGILMFKSMLKDSGLLALAARELIASGIPIVMAVALLPLFAGFVTGLAIGFTGTAFPLIAGLMAMDGIDLPQGATLVLAFGFGYMGMMLSPVHLCLLVSRDYFSANMLGVYRRILPCAAIMAVAAVALHILYAALGW